MGYKQIDQNMTFAEVSLLQSMEHNRSLKRLEKINQVINWSQVDAFFVINVDFWNYTRENDKKIGKVGLGIKMIEASTGKIMWKAGHHEAESYMLIKPDLANVAKNLIKTMVGEMPR